MSFIHKTYTLDLNSEGSLANKNKVFDINTYFEREFEYFMSSTPEVAKTTSDHYKPIPAFLPNDLTLSNLETVPGKSIVSHFGLVSGSVVRSKNLGTDIVASMKNIVGGELVGYTRLLDEARQTALERMCQQARELGANAVVSIRFATTSVAQGAAELYAYGTAVTIE
jgi:uncharacterized protein YbjQ (UPF0145 family)